MTFDPAQTDAFLQVFAASKEKIRAFEGCEHLELLNDVKERNVYCTYSIWQSEEHLDKYRFSQLFKDVWARTRPLFIAKPQAFSLEKVS
jgi:heme oxygenase (mycobilin-producing)